MCCGSLKRARVILDRGDLKEPGLEVDILHCVPMKCIFVLVARAIAVSACCHLKCGFLNLGLTLKLYSKYHGSIFKDCITEYFLVVLLFRGIAAGFSPAS